jgi:hypothetical protein
MTKPAKAKEKDWKETGLVDLDKLQALIREHEDTQGIRYCGELHEKLADVLAHYKEIATNSLDAINRFREDTIVQFRALSICVDMAGNAATHREKAARLRGLSEVIETSIQQMRKAKYDFQRAWFWFDDVFRSDLPTREMLQRIHELEEENKRLKGDASKTQPPQDKAANAA